MFYVYSRVYSSVYEPAEGGYYVETSKVDECFEHETIEAAMEDFLSWLDYVEQQGCKVYLKQTEIRIIEGQVSPFEAPDEYRTESWTVYPWARYGTGYIGDGFSIEISDVKPEDHPYEGYC